MSEINPATVGYRCKLTLIYIVIYTDREKEKRASTIKVKRSRGSKRSVIYRSWQVIEPIGLGRIVQPEH